MQHICHQNTHYHRWHSCFYCTPVSQPGDPDACPMDYSEQSGAFCVGSISMQLLSCEFFLLKVPCLCPSILKACTRIWIYTYRILLSRFAKKRPRMLMASTRRPPIVSMDMIVCTHSYKIALPAFLLPSVFVATCPEIICNHDL